MTSASAWRPSRRSTSRRPTSTPTRGYSSPRPGRCRLRDHAAVLPCRRLRLARRPGARTRLRPADHPRHHADHAAEPDQAVRRAVRHLGPTRGRRCLRRCRRPGRGTPDRDQARDSALRRTPRSGRTRSALLHPQPIQRDPADLRRPAGAGQPRPAESSAWETRAHEAQSGRHGFRNRPQRHRTVRWFAWRSQTRPTMSPPRWRRWPSSLRRAGARLRESKSPIATSRPPRCRCFPATTKTASRPRAFRAQHQLTVRVRELAQVGAVISAGIVAGENRVTIDSVEPVAGRHGALESQAREAAVADARRKASELATRRQRSSERCWQSPKCRAAVSSRAPSRWRWPMPADPIEAGEETVAVTVEVTFALD